MRYGPLYLKHSNKAIYVKYRNVCIEMWKFGHTMKVHLHYRNNANSMWIYSCQLWLHCVSALTAIHLNVAAVVHGFIMCKVQKILCVTNKKIPFHETKTLTKRWQQDRAITYYKMPLAEFTMFIEAYQLKAAWQCYVAILRLWYEY